jgi:hypothetical protein
VFVFAGLALLLVAASCGDDDDADSEDTTTSAASEDSTTSADTTETTTGDEAAAVPAGLCELAEEMFNADEFPTIAQLEEYQELAPEEIQADVELAAAAIIDADGDMTAVFVAIGEDDVEVAIDNINAYEEENCGIAHSENEALPPGSTLEIEPDAVRVDVEATEYAFAFDEPIAAGRTSFVLTNNGAEAHYMGLGKLAEGVELDEVFESDDGSLFEVLGDSGIAAPGGEDEEPLSVDLEPGNYGIVCFLPGPDGEAHAFLGMASEFTVA